MAVLSWLKPRAYYRAGTLLLVMLFMTACASTSVFSAYTKQADVYKKAIAEDDTEAVLSKLAGKANSADKILYLSESGRIHQLSNQADASMDDFRLAMDAYEKVDEEARLSASGVGALGASLLTNDNAIPYAGYGFERIFLYQFQAFNYLAKKDIQGASVELRRAAVEQRTQEAAHAKEIAQAEQKAREDNASVPPLANVPEFAGMDTLSGNVKNSFQNAYVFYTSAVIWEAQGDRNAALVDYKKALELNINNTSIQADVKRIDAGKRLSAQESALVILYEDGFIPQRQSFRLDIPDFSRNTFWSVAFPYYSPSHWYKPQPIGIRVGNKQYGETEVIANFGEMAVKALKEDVPKLIIRQILRARAKYEIEKQAGEQSSLAGFAAIIYNIVSEQADVRNWLTLPNNAQIKRVVVEPGPHQVELSLKGMSRSVEVEFNAGRTTILRVFNINNRLKTQQYHL
ncbi:MAG: hypothetical protein KAG18_00085 [Sinobacterium sp.]|nr:hypothetical protein [Sinobacterium sp.]